MEAPRYRNGTMPKKFVHDMIKWNPATGLLKNMAEGPDAKENK